MTRIIVFKDLFLYAVSLILIPHFFDHCNNFRSDKSYDYYQSHLKEENTKKIEIVHLKSHE